jgi:hypothetical protein
MSCQFGTVDCVFIKFTHSFGVPRGWAGAYGFHKIIVLDQVTNAQGESLAIDFAMCTCGPG